MKTVAFVGLISLLAACGDVKHSSSLSSLTPKDWIEFTSVASFTLPGGPNRSDPEMLDLDGDGTTDIAYGTHTVLLESWFAAKNFSQYIASCDDCFSFFADIDGDHVLELINRHTPYHGQLAWTLDKNSGKFTPPGSGPSNTVHPENGNVKAVIPDLNGDFVAEIVTQPGPNGSYPERCPLATVPTYLALSQPGKIYSRESVVCKRPGIFADINHDGYPDIFYMVNNGTTPSISVWDKNNSTFSADIEIKFDVVPYDSRYVRKELVKLVDNDHKGSLDIILVRLFDGVDKLEVLTYKQGNAVGEYRLFAKQTLDTTASWRFLRTEGNVGIEDFSIVDFDGDGNKDLVVKTNHFYGGAEDVEVHLGDRGQQFSIDYKLLYFKDRPERGFSLDSFVDFDHDGRLEYISAGIGMYENEFGSLRTGTRYTLWHQE